MPVLYYHAEIFYSSLDTLVPIVLRVGKRPFPPYQDIIHWFNPHETLFEKLPARYNYLKDVYSNLCCLKRKYPNKSFTNYLSPFGNNIYDPVNSINLNKEELRQIGVNIIENCIVLLSNDSENYIESCACSDCGHNKSYYDSINIVRVSKKSMPILKTDTLGRKIEYDRNSGNNRSIETNMNVLIPIKINKDKLLNRNGYKTELWWYYPTDEFISALPETIRKDLKSEIEIITNPNSKNKSSCTYFEVCKSILNLEDFVIFPNPAKHSITIEFGSMDELEGSISLVNISGSQLRTLVPKTSFISGKNSYQVDLSGTTPGIYLVSINTNKGFKTQRLIVSQ